MQNPCRSRCWVIATMIAAGIGLSGILVSCGNPATIAPTEPDLTSIAIATVHVATPTLRHATSVPIEITAGPTVVTPGGPTSEAHALPEFPWPPPKPSAFTDVPVGSPELSPGTGVNFFSVDTKISEALSLAGYSDRSYFAVPNGFAIVTRLEKTDAEGNPDPERWASSLEPLSLTEFSLTKYLEALFGAPQGHYRLFVFIVTSEAVIQSGTPVSQATAQTWIVEGANRLPFDLQRMPYTAQHSTTAYIYEFVQAGVGAEANQNIPSTITGRDHLERAGLWYSLTADCPPDAEDVIISYGNRVQDAFCLPGDNSDSFDFSGSSGEKIRIRIETTDPAFMPCAILYAPDFSSQDLGCENELTATATLTQSGMYWILLTNPDRIKPGDYTLLVERIE